MQNIPKMIFGSDERNLSFVSAEANLLRLPLFALSAKTLSRCAGFSCEGVVSWQGNEKQYSFRAHRAKTAFHPGPFARSVHFALLSILNEVGLPVSNPVVWRWRELLRKMKLSYSGQSVRQIKVAMQAVAGVSIYSEDAIYTIANGEVVSLSGNLQIYDRVVFAKEQLPDGSEAKQNSLWLSEWYLNNLNNLLTFSLDYDLWQELNVKSSIASRLYELMLISTHDEIVVRYDYLTSILPVKRERFISDAKKQLEPAFLLLQAKDVLRDVEWRKQKRGLARLVISLGERVKTKTTDQEDQENLGGSFAEFVKNSGIFQI